MGRKKTVTQSDLARAAGVSRQAIHKNRKIIKNSAGKVDIAESTKNFESQQNADLRYAVARANEKELEFSQKQGALVPIADEEKRWAEIAQTVRDNMMAIPDKIADELAALTDKKQVREKLLMEIRAVLTNLPESLRRAANRSTS
jgi:phage terminase Nu1 subunit (DNA packaging protein)